MHTRFLVTGANGFVGSSLCRHLVQQGAQVAALVRPTSDLSLLADVSVERRLGDVCDEDALVHALRDIDVVLHVAGVIAARDEAGFLRVNQGSVQTLGRAIARSEAPPRRVVLVSSISAAGPAAPGTPRTEGDAPAPVSMYGRSKLAGETAMSSLPAGVQRVIVRPPVVFGPGDRATLPLFQLASRGWAMCNGPDPQMSYVHVDDLAQALTLAGTHADADGGIFYVRSDAVGRMSEFQRAIGDAAGRATRTLPVPSWTMRLAGVGADLRASITGRADVMSSDKVREGLVSSWEIDDTALRTRLGYRPRYTLASGVQHALAWYQAQGWV